MTYHCQLTCDLRTELRPGSAAQQLLNLPALHRPQHQHTSLALNTQRKHPSTGSGTHTWRKHLAAEMEGGGSPLCLSELFKHLKTSARRVSVFTSNQLANNVLCIIFLSHLPVLNSVSSPFLQWTIFTCWWTLTPDVICCIKVSNRFTHKTWRKKNKKKTDKLH